MFTKIRLKNYKSFVDFSVDFLQKKGLAQKAVIIYGENGVGKSNFASAFYTLCESVQTISVRKAIQTFLIRISFYTLWESRDLFISLR